MGKWAGKGIAITVLASVIGLTSCKKETSISPENRVVNAAGTSTKSDYKPNQPILLNGAHDITISGESISGGPSSCITLTNCYNIHIINCKLANSREFAVKLSQCANIVVDKCDLDNVSIGVYSTNGQNIQVTDNTMKNIKGTLPGETMVGFEDARTGAFSNN